MISFIQNKKQQLLDFYKNDLFFHKKRLVLNYVLALSIMFVVFLVAFVLRQQAINATFETGFGGWKIIANPGISFGSLQGYTGLVYFLQIVPVVFSLITLIHCRYWLITIGLSLIVAAGMSNLIDRALVDYLGVHIQNAIPNPDGSGFIAEHAVIDYWSFNNSNTVFNFPDVFIIVGVIWTILFSLVMEWIKNNKFRREQEENEQEGETQPTSVNSDAQN